MEPEKKTYKAKLHVATSPFSFIEVEMEAESKEIVEVNDKLLARYKDNQK